MTKIMLVEDDNNLREIYQARLEAEGYEIVTAPDGEAALAMASKELPDLVISDVMMPKISGFEMLDILRNTEALRNVKIIMLTALGQAEDSQRANSLGADRYLVKSQVTLEDIVKATHDLLEGPAAAAPAPEAAAAPQPEAAPAFQAAAPAAFGPTPAPAQATDTAAPAGMPVFEPAAAAPAPEQFAAPQASSAPPVPDATTAPGIAMPEAPATPSAPETPEMNVVEAPGEYTGQTGDFPAVAVAPDAVPPSVPVSEASVTNAAPQPAAQEEATINDRIQNFIQTQAAAAPEVSAAPETPAAPPEVQQPQPAASDPAPQFGGYQSPPAAPADQDTPAPAPLNSAPVTAATPVVNDVADFEPAPEELNQNLAPTITSVGGSDTGSTDQPAASNDVPQPADPAPSLDNPQPTDTPAADQAMASAVNDLNTFGAPAAPASQPADDSVTQGDGTPEKKVISPLHNLNDKPDINKLLELEEARNSAAMAARTNYALPNQPPQSAPAPQQNNTPQQPFSAPAIDPNSISL